MPLLDYDALTFDCYGTLIDWETGLVRAVRETLPGVDRPEREILETFARFEPEEESAAPDLVYPEILARVHGRLAAEWGLPADEANAKVFGASVKDWPAFADSPAALQILKQHYRLVILSNVDRQSFSASQERLGVKFDFIYTAQDIGSYKPDPRIFSFMIERLGAEGIPKEKILHTAESLYHDHVPARSFGLANCWIYRQHDQEGFGATRPPGEDVKTDFRFNSLAEMADAVTAEAAQR